jgi:hypothetical protein
MANWAHSEAVVDLAKGRQVQGLCRELARVSRKLAELCLTVDLALDRHDIDTTLDSAEEVLALAETFKQLRRQLLVVGIRGTARWPDSSPGG